MHVKRKARKAPNIFIPWLSREKGKKHFKKTATKNKTT